MKILNEKHLAAYAAAPSSPADKQGWLLKRGEVNRTYQRRWFVLKGNLLFYLEKPSDREAIGVIILEGCTVECSEDADPCSFKIAFHGAGMRTYYLCAESQESMEDWMKAMSCASYDYMKVMVTELQRQVKELEELEKANEASMTLIMGTAKPRSRTQTSTPTENAPVERQNSGGRSTLFSRLSFKSTQNGVGGHDLAPHLKYPFVRMHDYFWSTLCKDVNDSPLYGRAFGNRCDNETNGAVQRKADLINL